MRDKLTKKYSNGEITVVWKPDLCSHSGNCWKGLAAVFNPKVRPWINMENATTDQIAAQVGNCPSGALSFFRNDSPEQSSLSSHSVVIEVTPDGPLVASGEIVIKLANGSEVKVRQTSLCRCGQSGNKPFCDGSHETSGFKG